jgi:hypothetical protein
MATEFLLLKSNKEYVLIFKILAQVLVGLLANLVQTRLYNTINQA